jgi:hypothetical protein
MKIHKKETMKRMYERPAMISEKAELHVMACSPDCGAGSGNRRGGKGLSFSNALISTLMG